MKLSTKGRYGLRCVIDLAENSKNGEYVTLSNIAQRQNLSANYLESIFSALKKGGIVSGFSGFSGGYKLADDPKSITIGQILSILEGDLSVSGNAPIESDNGIRQFIKQRVWDRIDFEIQHLLSTTTLFDLLGTVE